MSDWVAAPAVAVRSDSWSIGSVAVLIGVHVHAWLCRCCCCPILSSALSPGVPQVFSLLLACLDPCFDGEPPTVAVCSCSLPAFWVDVACLQISFENVFVSKDRLLFLKTIRKLTKRTFTGDEITSRIEEGKGWRFITIILSSFLRCCKIRVRRLVFVVPFNLLHSKSKCCFIVVLSHSNKQKDG